MYFKQLDSLRFFSVFLVLIAHWLHQFPIVEQLRLGAIGVEMFLVISGFLVTLQLFNFREEIGVSTTAGKAFFVFYLRRILRIFPLYYLVVVLTALFNKGEIREAFVWNISYLSNFYLIHVQHWPSTFSHFWSLSVEEHFYVFWPFIALLVPKRLLVFFFLSITFISILFRYVVFKNMSDYFAVYVHTISCLDLFMMGALLAFVYRYRQELFLKLIKNIFFKYGSTLVFIFFAALVFLKPEYQLLQRVYLRFIFGVCSFFILGNLVSGVNGILGNILDNKGLIHMGKLSYAIYLVHNFVPGILLGIKKLNLHFSFEFSIYLVFTLVISELLHRYIEQPIRKLNSQFVI